MLARTILVAVVIGLMGAHSAHAQARHERAKVTPIKKAGKVVGARVKVTLRPEGKFKNVNMILGKVEKGKWGPSTYRDGATGKKKGYVLHKDKEVKNVTKPKEHTFEILYGKKVAAGSTVDLTSVWTSGASGDAAHVWGMTRDMVGAQPITLPKD